MREIVLNRHLLGLEDLLFGVGIVTQIRAGQSVDITRINAGNLPFDETHTLLEWVQSVNLEALSGMTTELQAIYDNLTAIGNVEANLSVINALKDNLVALQSLYTNISKLQNIDTNMPKLQNIATNMPKLQAIYTDLAKLESIYNNLTMLLTIYNNLTALNNINSQVIPNLTELLLVKNNATQVAADKLTVAADKLIVATDKGIVAGYKDSVSAMKVAVESIYDTFDDRFLGVKTSDPTLDNDGNALQDGAMYFNSSSSALKVYSLDNTTWYTIPQGYLSGLLDVTLTSIATGDSLLWNGTKWVNSSLANLFIAKVPSTDNAVPRFDETGSLKTSSIIIDNNGNLVISGALRGSYGAGNNAINFAAGDGTLLANTTGYGNTATGSSALRTNITGNQNTALGFNALRINTTGNNNTAIGASTLMANTTGYNNTAVGQNALGNSTGNNNTAIGLNSLANSTGGSNTAVGINALTNNITFSNISGFGQGSQVTASNQVQLGDSATTTYVYGTVQNRSDIRDKAEVRDTVLGLDFIQSLRPVDYKWDMREDYKPERPSGGIPEKPRFDETEPMFTEEIPEDAELLIEYENKKAEYVAHMEIYNTKKIEYELELIIYEEKKAEYDLVMLEWLESCKPENIIKDGSKTRSRYHQGFIAQEVMELGVEFGGVQDHKIKGGEDILSIGYDEIIAPLVKAVQEQQAMIEELQNEVNVLKGMES